ncbi:MAG: hypothetical protein WC847_02540 [Candidatus Paceibacterota bacterium]
MGAVFIIKADRIKFMVDNNKKEKDSVVVHIDKSEYRSPNPTTGVALYALGNINSAEYDLYQEVPGHGDDKLIPADTTEIKLKNGEHFYSVQKKINPGA